MSDLSCSPSVVPVVAFAGSRRCSLGDLLAGGRFSARSWAAAAVAAVSCLGGRVRVGCCVGFDAAVVAVCLAAARSCVNSEEPAPLTVASIFDPLDLRRAGPCAVSNVAGVKFAAELGATVLVAAPPAAPVRARLAIRSRAVVFGPPPASLLVVPSLVPGSATFALAVAAAAAGVPVCCPRPVGGALPPLGPGCAGGGFWSSVSPSGLFNFGASLAEALGFGAYSFYHPEIERQYSAF